MQEENMEERLQKTIAKAGLASRRAAEKLIDEGMVTVNGAVVTKLGTKVDPDVDRIRVYGKLITKMEAKVYLILNKPGGYVTTMRDPQNRPIVIDLIKDVKERAFPVGRLDYDTEGLLMFTNDGKLCQRLLHPRNKVKKTYLVEIDGVLTSQEINKLELGIELSDGLASARLRLAKRRKNRSWWEVSVHEGRNRQVRRMFESIRRPIYGLKRIRFGPLELGRLKSGKYRFLTGQEISELKNVHS